MLFRSWKLYLSNTKNQNDNDSWSTYSNAEERNNDNENNTDSEEVSEDEESEDEEENEREDNESENSNQNDAILEGIIPNGIMDQFTDNEREQINVIMGNGYSLFETIQTYIACGKDPDVTLDLLSSL